MIIKNSRIGGVFLALFINHKLLNMVPIYALALFLLLSLSGYSKLLDFFRALFPEQVFLNFA